MKKHSEAKTRLQVKAGDDLTEISIIDNQFNRLASGLGSLSKDLVPGIYKVRWKTASTSKDKLVEISGKEEGGMLCLEAEKLAISTSAPLSNSTFGSIDRPNTLENLSGNPPAMNPDKACELLVFLRDENKGKSAFPFQSVSVHSPDGSRLANFKDGFIDKDARLAGLKIGLDPGVYRLRVETGPLGSYEIFIPTSKGWQTRVFLTCDDFYSGPDRLRRPTLRTASILMGQKGSRFHTDSQDARLAEIALNALLYGHDILGSSDMQDLLHGKFDDPMLGIYGAHLLLIQKRINWDLFDAVCRNLHYLVGPLPDVQALSAKSKQPMPDDNNRKALYLGLPPMLLHSWNLLVQHSRIRYSTIPLGSLSDRISEAVVSTKPWLMCRVESYVAKRTPKSPNISYAEANRVFAQMVERIGQPDRENFKSYLREQQEKLDPIENAILNAVVSEDKVETTEKRGLFFQLSANVEDSKDEPQSIDKLGFAKQALSKLPAPSYSIARSTISLASKLKDHFLDIDDLDK